MKHTPTPWTYSDYRNDDGTVSYFLQSSDEKQAIAELYVQPEAKGNADLIISCVNACDGIENPEAVKELIATVQDAMIMLQGRNEDYAQGCHQAFTKALTNLNKDSI